MSIEDLPLEAAYLHKANGPTGALDGVQPFGSLSMSYTDSIADGPGYLLLHMLARTAGERCTLGISPHANVHRSRPPLLRSPNFAYQGFGRQW